MISSVILSKISSVISSVIPSVISQIYCPALGTMGGSVMADAVGAVENAAAVVLCLTKELVHDLACRTVVTLAKKLKVLLIPIILEDNSDGGWIRDVIDE